MKDYLWVGVGRVGSSTENITQKMILTTPRGKTDPLLDALNEVDGMTIVFVAKKKTAGWLFYFLRDNNISATAIHGDRTQSERERALNDFKNGNATVYANRIKLKAVFFQFKRYSNLKKYRNCSPPKKKLRS